MTDPAGQVPLSGPPVLDFSGSRGDGFPVSTSDGVVAGMDVSCRTSAFGVRDPRGDLLCSGKVPFGAFGRHRDVVDATGAPVVAVDLGWGRTMPPPRPHACCPDVSSAGGRGVGFDFRRDLPASAWGFRPDAWLVEQDDSLTLTQFVAVVPTCRRVVQRRRGTAAAANA